MHGKSSRNGAKAHCDYFLLIPWLKPGAIDVIVPDPGYSPRFKSWVKETIKTIPTVSTVFMQPENKNVLSLETK